MSKPLINAILITLGLFIASLAVSYFLNINAVAWMIVVTSILVAIDSKKLELTKYRSGVSYNPFILFLLCVLFWIVGFTWYLYVRQKIKNGTAVLKGDETALAKG